MNQLVISKEIQTLSFIFAIHSTLVHKRFFAETSLRYNRTNLNIFKCSSLYFCNSFISIDSKNNKLKLITVILYSWLIVMRMICLSSCILTKYSTVFFVSPYCLKSLSKDSSIFIICLLVILWIITIWFPNIEVIYS